MGDVGPKAHALYVEGDVWGSVFREPAYLMQHQEYPILLPALEALTARALGRFDPALIDIGRCRRPRGVRMGGLGVAPARHPWARGCGRRARSDRLGRR